MGDLHAAVSDAVSCNLLVAIAGVGTHLSAPYFLDRDGHAVRVVGLLQRIHRGEVVLRRDRPVIIAICAHDCSVFLNLGSPCTATLLFGRTASRAACILRLTPLSEAHVMQGLFLAVLLRATRTTGTAKTFATVGALPFAQMRHG